MRDDALSIRFKTVLLNGHAADIRLSDITAGAFHFSAQKATPSCAAGASRSSSLTTPCGCVLHPPLSPAYPPPSYPPTRPTANHTHACTPSLTCRWWRQVAKFAIEAVSAANSVPVDLDDPSMGRINIRVGALRIYALPCLLGGHG